MTVFWSLAAVMVMVALLFVLPPLLRLRKVSAITRNDLNTKIIKEQLAELDADLAAGKLDKTQFGAARKDLERELLYDLDSTDNAPTEMSGRSGRWLVLLLVPAIPLCAVLLYQQLGSGELIDVLQQASVSQSEPAHKQATTAGSLGVMTSQLAERLRSEPDDLQGWLMLAKSYKVLQQPDDAARAYEQVLRLGGGNNPDILADYADAVVMANDGQFTDQSGALLLRALEIQPDHIMALWLAGHWKYDNHAYAEALRYWQKAAQQLPAGTKDATIIAQQISMAQAQLGTGGTPATMTKTTSDTTPVDDGNKASLNIHVALDPALSTSVAPDDTVFIYARATQGPRMPLAIVRKQVKDLPVSVTLDDSLAMSPQMVLSKFAQVTVSARISKSGNAMPRSGDLLGSVSPVATQATEKIQITINSKVP